MSTLQERLNAKIDEYFPPDNFVQAGDMEKRIKNTYGIICNKCKSDNIYESADQGGRSADEIGAVYYTCLNCGFKWRG